MFRRSVGALYKSLVLVAILIILYCGQRYFSVDSRMLVQPIGNILQAPFTAQSEIQTGSSSFAKDKTNVTVDNPAVWEEYEADATPSLSLSSPEPTSTGSLRKEGDATLYEQLHIYIKAILDPEDKTFDRLYCPEPRYQRYNHLQESAKAGDAKFFFAINLYQCAHLLPRLIGSVLETIKWLGPENCALSIVEGRSDDGTYEILDSLREEMKKLNVEYYFSSSNIEPKRKGTDRIKALADLRNLALDPLIEHADQYKDTKDTTVIFVNDVALCMEDILELVHQRVHQNADMTCAMDWYHAGERNPTFYDVWIARGMTGDTFFHIPENGSWRFAHDLFWNDPETKTLFDLKRPFQVFACWNGITAFTATPILQNEIKFRTGNKETHECYQGEPNFFCKEMWLNGHGKIMVVPSVNVEYTDAKAQRVKNSKGYVGNWIDNWAEKEGEEDEDLIVWKKDPPKEVKCMSTYSSQKMLPWNEGMGDASATGVADLTKRWLKRWVGDE